MGTVSRLGPAVFSSWSRWMKDLQRGEGHVHAAVVGDTWARCQLPEKHGKTWKNHEKLTKTHKIIWKIWEQLGRYGKNRRYLENIWNKMDTFGGRNHKYRDPFGTYLILFTHRSPLFTRYVQSGPPGPELGTRVHEFFEVSSFTSHFDTFWSHQLSKIWGKGGASLPV